MTDPRYRWDDEAHELLIWWRGQWWGRDEKELPADMVERIDAAMRHVEDPARNPWPEGEDR